MRHHLGHLGIQALPHFGAAMVHQNGAIGVDMHQSARLIEVRHVKRDAKLQRRQRQPALEHRTLRIEHIDGFTPGAVVARCLQLSHQFVNHVVANRLLVGRDIVLPLAVEVDAPHIERITPQIARHRIQNILNSDSPLRPAKAAKCGIALGIGLAHIAVHVHIGQPVGIVEVAQRTRHHRRGQVCRVARTRDHGNLHAQHAPFVVMPHFVFVPEAMAATGNHEVIITVQTQLHRLFQTRGRYRRHAGKQC